MGLCPYIKVAQSLSPLKADIGKMSKPSTSLLVGLVDCSGPVEAASRMRMVTRGGDVVGGRWESCVEGVAAGH